MVALSATACTIGDDGAAAPSSASSTAAPAPAAAGPGGPAPTQRADPLQAALDRAVEGIPGRASIAVAAGDRVVTAGNSAGLPAWSTSKVPLVMAALERSGQQRATDRMRAAITQSDNDAAEAIWDSLGTPAQAGAAVQNVLREGRDTQTRVQTEPVRPPFSAFGQTLWTDGAAAQFAARIPCSPAGLTTLGLMQQVAGNQQWGLYGLRGAQPVGVKGGWGPGTDGAYVVRQLAVVRTERGSTGVMLSVRPADGALASGEAALTILANAVRTQLRTLPAAPC
ncbi:hypothetical protein [Tsukamurella pseudospumae]|uniref:Serine hydrolase n=1 Tax=Tsukamurella pseudospumae TaxID=239498 RepID=A0A137ZK29_9ACTN|nr:hypothetical protein [Tsukamurella pseudospumae]KXO98523.1 hypothetical protein AXK61_02710 [Tsukamurella pseudospumae]